MLRRSSFLAALFVTAVGLAPKVSLAHHGWSGYQAEAVTVTGVIRNAAYESPHGSVSLETPDRTWLVVLAPPSRMQARGLPREALKPGVTATVTGYAHRSNPAEMRAERITIADRTTELR